MNFYEYQKLAERTESPADAVVKRVVGLGDTFPPLPQLERLLRICHGIFGINTESGELVDSVKRHVFYGQPLDAENIREEIGDILWYVALLCNSFSWNMGEIAKENIAKLRQRFPEKFTEHDAAEENRDRSKEQKAAVLMRGEDLPEPWTEPQDIMEKRAVGTTCCIVCGADFTVEHPAEMKYNEGRRKHVECPK